MADESPRFDALVRIWAFIWAWTVGWVLVAVALIIGSVVAFLDILLQLIFGSEIFDDDAGVSVWVTAVLQWNIDNMNYALTGRGEFDWWPGTA